MTLDIKRILVPLDFSANSELALDYARAMARRFGAALHLVHVCEVPEMATGPVEGYVFRYSDWGQRLGDEAERLLIELEERLPDVKVYTEVLFGNAARCIVTAAEVDRTDLIVMGTHGRGPLMHALMGNVAERVVRTAPCPVLTVREPREAERVAEEKASGVAVMRAVGALMPLHAVRVAHGR